jgi:hypothetical protein
VGLKAARGSIKDDPISGSATARQNECINLPLQRRFLHFALTYATSKTQGTLIEMCCENCLSIRAALPKYNVSIGVV